MKFRKLELTSEDFGQPFGRINMWRSLRHARREIQNGPFPSPFTNLVRRLNLSYIWLEGGEITHWDSFPYGTSAELMVYVGYLTPIELKDLETHMRELQEFSGIPLHPGNTVYCQPRIRATLDSELDSGKLKGPWSVYRNYGDPKDPVMTGEAKFSLVKREEISPGVEVTYTGSTIRYLDDRFDERKALDFIEKVERIKSERGLPDEEGKLSFVFNEQLPSGPYYRAVYRTKI